MNRILSIDIFRALVVLLMIFVNDLPSVKDVPYWLGHAAFDEDFMGVSDVVFPCFLLIMGMSIPLAINKRLEQNKSNVELILHILKRSFALIVMGVFSVNSGKYLSGLSYITPPMYSLLMLIAFFLIWNNYPRNYSKLKIVFVAFQVLGVMILCYILYVFHLFSDEPFGVKWWGILGLIGWSYMTCALLFLFFRNKNKILFYVTILFMILCVLGSSGYLYSFNGFILSNGCFQSFTMSGVLLTLLLTSQNIGNVGLWSKRGIIILVSSGFLLFGYISNHWCPISKLRETPPWLFYSLSISLLFFLVIDLLVNTYNKSNWFKLIKPVGTATLTCYLVPSLLYSLFSLFRITFADFLLVYPLGLLKSLVFSFMCVLVTYILGIIGIRLKV